MANPSRARVENKEMANEAVKREQEKTRATRALWQTAYTGVYITRICILGKSVYLLKRIFKYTVWVCT